MGHESPGLTKQNCNLFVPDGVRHLLLRVLLVSGIMCGGCAYHVRPPRDVQQPVSVFLADYGAHASLILPRADDQYAEFAYGEWAWFVRDQTQWYRVVPVLLLPTKAGLGTRILEGPPSEADPIPGAEHHYEIHVEASAAESLLRELEALCAGNGEPPQYNPRSGLNFQPDNRPYSILRQCNSMVAHWLRQLGCQVTGSSITANFVIADEP